MKTLKDLEPTPELLKRIALALARLYTDDARAEVRASFLTSHAQAAAETCLNWINEQMPDNPTDSTNHLNPPDVPIHACHGSSRWVTVTCKTGLYSNEIICTVLSGELGRRNPNVNALELASMICEALEAKRKHGQV